MASSRVRTTRGLVPIINIKEGDEVFTWNEGRLAVHQVTWRSEPRHQMTYRLTTAGGHALAASGNHPFLRLTGTGGMKWTELDDLSAGDTIVAEGAGRHSDFNAVLIEEEEGIKPLAEDDTYDITVEGAHNFIAEGLVLHNSGFSAAGL